MSQYYGNTRTNYFRVTDPNKFRSFIEQVKDEEDQPVILWEETDKAGVTRFAFGCYSDIVGIPERESFFEKIVFKACAEAFSAGHLTEDVLTTIFEELDLTGLEYDKDKVTAYFHEMVNDNDFANESDEEEDIASDEYDDDEYEYDDVEYTYDGFIEELQKFLPEGEVVVITEAGHEKLICVNGAVTVVTKNDCKLVTLDDVAAYLAKQMTQNEDIKLFYH